MYEYGIVLVVALVAIAGRFVAMVAAVLVGLWIWDRWQRCVPTDQAAEPPVPPGRERAVRVREGEDE